LNGYKLGDMFDPTKAIRLPEHVQTIIETGVSSSRGSFEKATDYAKQHMRTFEDIFQAAHSTNKELGEKVFGHAEANAEAVFKAAQNFARAKTLPELARLQSDFFQQQLTTASAQGKELFELTTQLAQDAFATINSAVAKSFKQLA
jgi:phasin family protein